MDKWGNDSLCDSCSHCDWVYWNEDEDECQYCRLLDKYCNEKVEECEYYI